jgi:hypothetical protein
VAGTPKLIGVLDATIVAATTCLGASLGVFLALRVQSRHEAALTDARVCTVIEAARAGAHESRSVIAPNSDSEHLADRDRLLLAHPARVLTVLVDMPDFIERASRDAIVNLSHLRSALDWTVAYRNEPSLSVIPPRGPKRVSADPQAVRQQLQSVEDLLGAEQKRLCH